MWVTDECKNSFMEMKWKKVHRYIVFKFEEESGMLRLKVEKVGGGGESYEDLAASLPKDDCRYAVFDFDFQNSSIISCRPIALHIVNGTYATLLSFAYSDPPMPHSFLLFFFFLLTVPAALADGSPKTYIFRVDSRTKPAIFPTHYHWYTSEFTQPSNILHVYDTVFHGFSASLNPSQAASVLRHPSILAAFEDRRRHLHTTRSPQFLGLRNQRGLWSDSDYGSDVIIGVFDTGVWPERRSFSDLNLGPVPSRWKGVCETGAKFTAQNCNRKIVGARCFSPRAMRPADSVESAAVSTILLSSDPQEMPTVTGLTPPPPQREGMLSVLVCQVMPPESLKVLRPKLDWLFTKYAGRMRVALTPTFSPLLMLLLRTV
nr:subtilisin-like protease SBT1.6 [Ipomoea batatas]